MMKRTLALPLTAFALLAASCTSSGTTTGPPDTDSATTDPDTTTPVETDPTTPVTDPGGNTGPIGFAPASLQQFGDCSAFLDYVHTEGAERVGPYGLEGVNNFGGPEVMMAVDEASGDATASTDAPADTQAASESRAVNEGGGGDGSFSTTNVQVDGVDEPDIVKSDGDRILAIAGETLYYIDVAADGTTGTKRGSIALGSETQYAYGYEIFVNADRAFVFAQTEYYNDFGRGGPVMVDDFAQVDAVPVEAPPVDAEPVDAEADLVGDEPAPSAIAPVEDEVEAPEPKPIEPDQPIDRPIVGGYVGPQTMVIEIDLSNPDDLSIANTMTIDGRYISARSIGETARVVVTSPPQDLGFLYPSNNGTEDKATEVNRQVVADSTVEDWIPGYTVTGANGEPSSGQLVDCANIHAPADFGGFDMLSIVTLDLSGSLGAPTGTSSVVASGDTVYASQDRMYVTTNIWEPIINEQTNEWLDENYQTAVHRFSIAGDGPAKYEASGAVHGHLLNQFSMNDREGTFYVATTTGAPWSGDGSESQIVAMEVNGDQLVEIGKVGGLGKGERIFSVRYVGETAYVVTFRQTDPFYVLDLSDPRNMTIQGELKIPGFSSYLHPISDTLVLGVGQDATDDGRTTGTKVSLFDVSDPANPLEVDVWTLPNGFSDAEFDHRAFLWWAPTNTAVLPLQSYTDRFAGAVVLKIENNTITEQGRITQRDDEVGNVGQTDCQVLNREDLVDDNGELDWIFQEGNQVNLCTANQQGGAIGMYCDVIPLDQIDNYYSGEINLDTSQFERIEYCYQDWNGYTTAVQRTMVIDGNLWTLSPTRVQSNDLGTLDRTAVIDLT